MNSKQRRKDRKRWSYVVTHDYNLEPWQWRQRDDCYLAMFDWCVAQWGDHVVRCGWRDRDIGQRWEFDCAKKAMMFALRWGS